MSAGNARRNDDDNLLGPLSADPAETGEDSGGDFFSKCLETSDSAIADLLESRKNSERASMSHPAVQRLVDEPQSSSDSPPVRPTDQYTSASSASNEDSPAPAGLSMLANAAAAPTIAGSKQQQLESMRAGSPLKMIPDDNGLQTLPSASKMSPLAMTGEQTISLADAHIDDLLRCASELGASDMHLASFLPPMSRRDGKVGPMPYETAAPRDIQRLVYDILTTDQIEKFERTKELDFSYGVKGLGRYRFNVYRQRGSVGAAMRLIPTSIPTLDSLKLPPILRELTRRHSGLILVTGPTGSGKSTTIASMIDIINTERPMHIMTIEDPIEYLHNHKSSMINQRELGTDTDSFYNALRAVLREDPDVILVGEMRDLETISAAITLAETGHLVFATLHTRSAPATIDRIVDVFPAHQQEQIRIQLSTSLEAVVSQQLIPRPGGGRICATEIMVATSALRNLIREGKTHQMYSVIETGAQYGMQTMDRTLADMHRSGQIAYEEALSRSIDRESFQRLVRGA